MLKQLQKGTTIVQVSIMFVFMVIVPNLHAAPVAGNVSGLHTIQSIKCKNATSGQRVTIRHPDNGLWDCEQAGLIVNTGDVISLEILGKAQGLIPDRPETVSVLGAMKFILLQWNQASGVSHYTVYRALQADVTPILANKVADTENAYYIDTSVTPDVPYYYVVTASSDAGESHPSNSILAATDISGLNHSTLALSCALGGCHDGIGATGKNVNHIPSSDSCADCHLTSAWLPATFDHAGITGSCDTCHNNVITTGKPSDHFGTALDCNACHQTTVWLAARYVHQNYLYPGDHYPGVTCIMCHGTNNETVIYPAPNLAPDCAGCHAAAYKPASHSSKSVTVDRNCGQSGCHRVRFQTW